MIKNQTLPLVTTVIYWAVQQHVRVQSKLKEQNSSTSQGLLKDLKLQFSSTKVSIKRSIILALHQNLEWNIYF